MNMQHGRWFLVSTLAMLTLNACTTVIKPQPIVDNRLTDASKPVPEVVKRREARVYLGAGLGLSRLEPDTSQVANTDVSETDSAGMQLTLGVDVSDAVSLEGHFATLGNATVSSNGTTNNGDIDYSEFGVSALYYIGGDRDRYKRRGAKAYLRGGLGLLQNDADETVRYEQSNAVHVLLGLGAEVSHRSGLGVRGELISFEGDANYMQLALLYRFGDTSSEAPVIVAEENTLTTEESSATASLINNDNDVETPSPLPSAHALAIFDSDRDGIAETTDQCPNTNPIFAVDENGCPLYDGVLEGVNFNLNKATLTDDAQRILDEVVQTLARFPAVKLNVSAHTDSQGSAEHNLELSRMRARAVVNYLKAQGITGSRLKASAHGESKPIASNETVEGRRRNRRVELTALHSR